MAYKRQDCWVVACNLTWNQTICIVQHRSLFWFCVEVMQDTDFSRLLHALNTNEENLLVNNSFCSSLLSVNFLNPFVLC